MHLPHGEGGHLKIIIADHMFEIHYFKSNHFSSQLPSITPDHTLCLPSIFHPCRSGFENVPSCLLLWKSLELVADTDHNGPRLRDILLRVLCSASWGFGSPSLGRVRPCRAQSQARRKLVHRMGLPLHLDARGGRRGLPQSVGQIRDPSARISAPHDELPTLMSSSETNDSTGYALAPPPMIDPLTTGTSTSSPRLTPPTWTTPATAQPTHPAAGRSCSSSCPLTEVSPQNQKSAPPRSMHGCSTPHMVYIRTGKHGSKFYQPVGT